MQVQPIGSHISQMHLHLFCQMANAYNAMLLMRLRSQLCTCPCRFSRENVDLAAALLTLACLGEGKEVSWAHKPKLRSLLGRHSIREASR